MHSHFEADHWHIATMAGSDGNGDLPTLGNLSINSEADSVGRSKLQLLSTAYACSYCPVDTYTLSVVLLQKSVRERVTTVVSCNLCQVVERKEDFDWTRHMGFVTFGFMYLGCAQYYLYNVKFVQASAVFLLC